MKKYNYNLSTLTDENENSFYILGAFISDGCITKSGKNTFSSSFGSKDKDWVESIRDLFDPNIKILESKNFYKLGLYNKSIGEWFINHNCTPNKSLTVQLPNVPDKYIADLIRGIFDGDGSLTIYTDKRKLAKNFNSYICGSSNKLLKSIQHILEIKKIKSIIVEIKKLKHNIFNNKKIVQKHKHWRLIFNKTNTLKFLSFIYYKDHKLSLTRKLLIFQKMQEIYEDEKQTNNLLNKNCKIQWPSDDELIKLVQNNTYKEVGRILGVSNVSVVERMKVRNIYIPKGRGNRGIKK